MTNAQRLVQVERGLSGVTDEYERAWWQERVDFMREVVKRHGADATTPTGNWRKQLAAWREGQP